MSGLWLRLYTECLNDPKVQKLPGDIFKTWINILCLAKETDACGDLPDTSDMAFILRMDERTLMKHLEALNTAGLLEGDGFLAVHGWMKRQPRNDSDPTNVDRQRRYREKSRENSNGKSNALRNAPVTEDRNALRNGEVTPLEKSREELEERREHTPQARDDFDPPDDFDPVPQNGVRVIPFRSDSPGKVDELFAAIRNAFQSKNLNWGRPDKQVEAIHRLCALIRQKHPADAMAGAAHAVTTYWNLTETQDKFWGRQPFTPEGLLSLWDRVIKQIRQDSGDVEPEWMRGMV